MTTIRKATQRDIRVLSRKLLKFLEDKNSQIYQDNVAKFGIPEEYVKKAFAEERLLKAVSSREATFYLALENNEIIGFAQIIQQDSDTVELDRIVVFPKHMRKGIGTQMLEQAIMESEHRGIKTIVVKAGKEETHARRFYEKNRFKQVEERTVETPWGKELTLVTYQLQLKTA
jgi:N-acetylglutamate synthase-like GNAT family acetyltransferase